jgi:hypothetical protein
MATYKDPTRSIDSLRVASGNTSADAVDQIKIKGTANAANANLVTITNASHGQASTYTLQDCGSASANLVSSGTLVNGNLAQASGAGSLSDSTITASSVSSVVTQLGNTTMVTVTMLPADVTVAYTTPKQLIAAPGTGKMIVVQEASIYTNSTGNTPYATGTAPIIQYDSTAHGAGTSAIGSGLVAGDITAASSQVRTLGPSVAALTGVTNKGIFFSNATGNYTAGTGTNIVITLTYITITATV